MEIIVDDLSGREVHELLSEHLRGVSLNLPPESVHALDLEGLRQPGITFWTVWEGGELLGCGALNSPLKNAIVAFFNPRQVRSTARKTSDFIAGFSIASMR